MQDLKGKWVLVTGAARGIEGRLFEAQRFAGLSLAEAVEKAAGIPSPW